MNSHTSAEVNGQSIGLVSAIFDGESQMSKAVMDYILQQIVWKDAFLGYPCCCSSDSGAVIGSFSCVINKVRMLTTPLPLNNILNIVTVCVILNYMASPALGGICSIQALNGQTPDVSFLQYFSFFEPVYYQVDDNEPDYTVPSASNEKKRYLDGFADNVGMPSLKKSLLRILTNPFIGLLAAVLSILLRITNWNPVQARAPHCLLQICFQ